MAKAKQRAETYDKPLAVKGTFEDLVKLSVSNIEVKKQPLKAVKKNKKGNDK